MQTLIETFLNGNLTDAKAKAKRFNHRALRQGFEELAGFSVRKAALAADFLKGLGSFQEYCDAI